MNEKLRLTPKKRAFLTGTLLLTGTGFLCRALGFFYRIFLSRTVGAEGLGIYNLVHPVFGICFALCAGSMQTALSQYIASHAASGRRIFRTGLAISMSMSFILAFLICQRRHGHGRQQGQHHHKGERHAQQSFGCLFHVFAPFWGRKFSAR